MFGLAWCVYRRSRRKYNKYKNYIKCMEIDTAFFFCKGKDGYKRYTKIHLCAINLVFPTKPCIIASDWLHSQNPIYYKIYTIYVCFVCTLRYPSHFAHTIPLYTFSRKPPAFRACCVYVYHNNMYTQRIKKKNENKIERKKNGDNVRVMKHTHFYC